MGKMSYSEIYEKSVEKASSRCCPDCETSGSLQYADSEVLVCSVCGYSIEAEELQPKWQEIIEEDEGFFN